MNIEEFPDATSTKKERKSPRSARVPYGYNLKRAPMQPATPEEVKVAREVPTPTAESIVEAAVSIARYTRSLQTRDISADHREHFVRLIRITEEGSAIRFRNAQTEGRVTPRDIEKVGNYIASIDWATVPDMPVPTFVTNVPADGTEHFKELVFVQQPADMGLDLPA